MIPVEELNRFAQLFNLARQQIEDTEGKAAVPTAADKDTWCGIFNCYLFLLKENKVAPDLYETVKKALQDITNWVTVGLDVETLEIKPEISNGRTLMEI